MDRVFEEIRTRKIQEIVVLGAPARLRPELSRLPAMTIHHHYESVRRAGFWLAFVTRKSELDALAPEIAARLSEDGILWIAFQKNATKSDLSEEACQETLQTLGFSRVETAEIAPHGVALRFERAASGEIQNEKQSEMPSESVPVQESDNQTPSQSKTGGNNAGTARKTAPRAGRGSQNSARSGHVRDTNTRAARPGSRSRSASQSASGSSDAGKQ